MRDREDLAQLRAFWLDYAKYCRRRHKRYMKHVEAEDMGRPIPPPRMSAHEALKLIKKR